MTPKLIGINMSKQNQSQLLYQKIKELEEQRIVDLADLKEEFVYLKESSRPSNLIKQSFSEVLHNTTLNKKVIVGTLTSIALGYISKKIFEGNSKNNSNDNSNDNSKKLIGNILKFALPLVIKKFNTSNVEQEYQE